VGIFEPHLHNLCGEVIGIVGQPITLVELVAARACLGRKFALLGAKLTAVTERKLTPSALGNDLLITCVIV
jgi:hypothetical protein